MLKSCPRRFSLFWGSKDIAFDLRFFAVLPSWYLGWTLWQESAHKRDLVLLITVAAMVLYFSLWVLGVHAVQN